jgi:hypothetical protein
MKGIVWGLTIQDAIMKLKEIEEEYRLHTNVIACRQTKYVYEIRFENGDHWIACNIHESNRGHKCNVSYIDGRIDKEVVNRLIKHCTVAYPFQAFNYFYDFVETEKEI